MTQCKNLQTPLGSVLLLWLAGCGSTLVAVTDQAASIDVECAASALPKSAVWTCPAPQQLACAQDSLPPLIVQSPTGQVCDATGLHASDLVASSGQAQLVSVSDASGAVLCSTQITLTDDAAPVLSSHTLQLWPPNHKLHDIAVEDCVSAVDACDGALQGEFIWASSDEPVDDIGDGHHSPDILLADDCRRVSVRSERQGPKNGRVYKLGVRVVDRHGNASEGECQVIVDHDQRGVIGSDSGEAYRITFDGKQAGPSCDGVPPVVPPARPPVEPPIVPPPAPPVTEPPPVAPPPATPIPNEPV